MIDQNRVSRVTKQEGEDIEVVGKNILSAPPPSIVEVVDLPDCGYPFDPRNFFTNAGAIQKFIDKYHPKTICELGSMLGGSTRFWAERVDKVVAVDHWDWKRFETLGQSVDDPPKDPTWPTFFERFISNCYRVSLQDKIAVLRATTVEAAEYCKQNKLHFDVVYIDAEHASVSVKRDIDLWLPLADRLCGDDWGWVNEPYNVQGAVKEKAQQYGFEIEAEGNFWSFVRK